MFPRGVAALFVALSLLLAAAPALTAADFRADRSALCHVTDGVFTNCEGGQEWSDVPVQRFEDTDSTLYADQADLDPARGNPNSPVDTFTLMYERCSLTKPLPHDKYVRVTFDTVEIEDGKEVFERYVVHLFGDGTMLFFENGELEHDENGQARVTEIDGQRGAVGFGPSPTCPRPHVIAEYEIELDAASTHSYSPDPLYWSSGTPCDVDIMGAPANMDVGRQMPALTAAATGGTPPYTYSWTIAGDVIRDYDERSGRFSVTPMTPADLTSSALPTFYWKPLPSQVHPSGGAAPRDINVTVTDDDGEVCSDRKTVSVERNLTDETRQAEDAYTTNHSGRLLPEHETWHMMNREFGPGSYSGRLFFNFHRGFLANFDRFRAEFGYPPLEIWDPKDPLPTGPTINHAGRNSPYTPFPRPPWFTAAGGGGARTRTTGMDCDLPPDGQTSLGDFPSDQELLGCAVTHPWHNTVHERIGGDMGDPTTAPVDPIFWRWHTYVTSVSDERATLTPPTLFYETPFRLFHYITELPPITVTFSEPVTGVTPGALTVEGSPATSVTGSGDGPYTFSGFAAPALGNVDVALAGATIVDAASEAFGGDAWHYHLIDPNADADGDGLKDGEEVDEHRTHPTTGDSDADGLPDAYEVEHECLNPLEDELNPMAMGTDPPPPGDADADDDGRTNAEERSSGSNPCSRAFPGGPMRPGFDDTTLPGNDDGSTGAVPIGFPLKFFGSTYEQLFVNNNGNVTFGSAQSAFTPSALGALTRPIIAPFWADVQTNGGGGQVEYGAGTVGGRPAFGVTWPGVGCFGNGTLRNTFQLVLVDRSDRSAGDFDAEFNYFGIEWETGTASGGSSSCLGGSSARAGYSAGTNDPSKVFEIEGSGVDGAFLDDNLETGLIHHSRESGVLGRYRFEFHDGAAVPLDGDGDGVPTERDNCPSTPNPPQEDDNLNGIGNACEATDHTHETAGFLQATLDGGTTGEAGGTDVAAEPGMVERLVRIVDFRMEAGLADDRERLTRNLVESVVAIGLIRPEDAERVIAEIVGPRAADAGQPGGPGGPGEPPPILRPPDPPVVRPACLDLGVALAARRLGPARLGTRRTRDRSRLRVPRVRSRGAVDAYCLSDGATLRIGYATRRVVRGLRRSLRRRVLGRAVLALTTSRLTSIQRVRVGTRTRALRRRLKGERRVRAGRVTWYFARLGRGRMVAGVRGGRVVELGVVDGRVARGRRGTRRLLTRVLR